MAASKNPRARLLHIRDGIEGVAAMVRGLLFVQYQGSYMHRRAVERAVQIVSEAAKALPPDYLAKYPDAPWNAIVGIGNVLRHEYQRLDDKQLWEIVTVHLPKLQPIVAQMLREIGADMIFPSRAHLSGTPPYDLMPRRRRRLAAWQIPRRRFRFAQPARCSEDA